MRNLPGSLAAFQRAIQACPTSVPSLINLANALRCTGNLKEAADACQLAIKCCDDQKLITSPLDEQAGYVSMAHGLQGAIRYFSAAAMFKAASSNSDSNAHETIAPLDLSILSFEKAAETANTRPLRVAQEQNLKVAKQSRACITGASPRIGKQLSGISILLPSDIYSGDPQLDISMSKDEGLAIARAHTDGVDAQQAEFNRMSVALAAASSDNSHSPDGAAATIAASLAPLTPNPDATKLYEPQVLQQMMQMMDLTTQCDTRSAGGAAAAATMPPLSPQDDLTSMFAPRTTDRDGNAIEVADMD